MQLFVCNYIVQAEPATDDAGRQGWDVYYPDGRIERIPRDDFEIHFRYLDVRERLLMEMTTDELDVMRITDKDYEHKRNCAHRPPKGHIAGDPMFCDRCGAPMD
jgi:hypothetical protein